MRYRKRPLHRDVRALRRLQKEVLFRHIPLDRVDAGMPLSDIEEVLMQDRRAFAALSDDMEELVYVGTIMLATGLSPEDIEALDEGEFWEHYERSREALGGTCEDFLSRYTLATTFQITAKDRQLETSSPRRGRSGSGTSSERSGARRGARS